MSDTTKISWTHHTFNMIMGCNKVGPGCENCYAEEMVVNRYHRTAPQEQPDGTVLELAVWGPRAPRKVLSDKYWLEPHEWNYQASIWGERRRVFCCSLGDVFENHPTVIGELPKLWPLIRATPWLDWLLLTKRSNRIEQSLPEDWGAGYPNVWLGVSVEDDHHSRLKRVDDLRKIPAAVRFISYEPALSSIAQLVDLTGIDWLIYGGESGPNYRQDDPQWAEDIRELCEKHGTAFYYKQGAARQQAAVTTLNGVTYHNYPTGRVPIPVGI
jgi:protein gp37